MYQAKSGVKKFSLYVGGGGGTSTKKFFFQSEHVSSQIWCQKIFPLLRPGPPPPKVWIDTQSENITSRHPSDAGGKNTCKFVHADEFSFVARKNKFLFLEMKMTDEAKYEFKTKFPMECVSEEMYVEVKQQVKKRAADMTENLSCLRDGTCSLDEPQIKGCDNPSNSGRKRRATNDDDDNSNTNKELNIKVSITYHGKFASLSAPGR